MTRLTKPVTRLMRLGELGDMVVTLCPDGMLRLRKPRKVKFYEYPVEAIWWRAVERAADELRREKAAKRKGRAT